MRDFVPVQVPEWSEWGQRYGLKLRHHTDMGPNGRRLCRWCHGQTEAPRRCWCSQECVNAYGRVATWDAMRTYIKQRDRETCRRCGTTEPPPPERRPGRWWTRSDPWDVDHIVPVEQGGTDDPANLRLLCIPCHNAVGYEQRGERNPQTPPLKARSWTFLIARPHDITPDRRCDVSERGGCEWRENDDGVFESACGRAFILNDGRPAQNHMRFCCYCGRYLIDVRRFAPTPDGPE